MAGLIDYVMMGLGVAGLYIGVKYGPQIVNNMKQPAASSSSTPTAPSTTPTITTTNPVYAPETGGVPTAVIKAAQKRGNRPVPRHINPQTGDETLDTAPSHIPVSNDIKTKPSNEHKRRKTTLPVHHQGPCPDGSYPDKDNNCKPIPTLLEAKIGYFDYYSIPVDGPGWRKSIPYNQLVASQGMATRPGRVKRALAANNSNFMPGGFVLSEASVRRGVNNVYSAGT